MSNRNAWVMAVAGMLAFAPAAGAVPVKDTRDDAPTPVGDTRDDAPAPVGDEAVAPRPFIERSLLLVPEQAGAMTLVGVHVYERSEDGVGFRYRHPDFPDVRIDLFVYPRGRATRDFALDEGMAGMRASIDYAVEQGGYTDLAYGEEGPIDLRRIGPDGSWLPEVEPAADGASASNAEPEPASESESEHRAAEALLASLVDAKEQTDRDIGRRLALQLSIQGDPLDSRAYLFYDALYLIKGRISASPQELPGELFDRFADRAMADLVPKVQVRNTGGCTEMKIYVDPEAKDGPGDLAGQLMRAMAQGEREGCAATLDESVPEGYRGTVLEIDPATWDAPAG